jgi:hypothetical protein
MGAAPTGYPVAAQKLINLSLAYINHFAVIPARTFSTMRRAWLTVRSSVTKATTPAAVPPLMVKLSDRLRSFLAGRLLTLQGGE